MLTFSGGLHMPETHSEFRPRVIRYLARRRGRSGAKGLAQESMIRIQRGLARFNPGSTLATWIFKIAINTASDWQKGYRS